MIPLSPLGSLLLKLLDSLDQSGILVVGQLILSLLGGLLMVMCGQLGGRKVLLLLICLRLRGGKVLL